MNLGDPTLINPPTSSATVTAVGERENSAKQHRDNPSLPVGNAGWRFRRLAIFLVCLLGLSRLTHAAPEVTIVADDQQPQVAFAVQELEAALAKREHRVSHAPFDQATNTKGAHIILTTASDATLTSTMRSQDITPSDSLKPEGFSLRQSSDRQTTWVIGADAAGVMYGGLELAEMIRISDLSAVGSVDQNPHLSFRGIKFNCPLDDRTPTYENHNGDSEAKNVLVMWDASFWKACIDNLAHFRYNSLSLWNLHPFPSMVRVPGFESIALADVVAGKETRKMSMDEKIAFWREVMRYAKSRNVSVHVVTWNIFVPGPEGINSSHGYEGLTPENSDPKTTEYFRKSVRQMFLTYPNLAGIGLTAGERMGNISKEQKEMWAFNTYGQGILNAVAEEPDRKFTLIHRVHETDVKEITNVFAPVIQQPKIDFLLSFKYAKGHVFSSTIQPFAKKYLKQLDGQKTLWTLRNDDNFFFRWGAPDFVREFIRNLPKDVTTGFYYGSDGYVWGREFLSKEPESPRQLELDKHWYHWMLWGRIAYNPDLTNERFAQLLGVRFPEIPADDLFTAWQEASMTYPLTTGFHWGALDFEWFIEGCRSIPSAAKNESGFHDVDRFISLDPHPGTDNLSIPKYVDAVTAGKTPKGTTPVQVSQQLQTHADKALKLLDAFPKVSDNELRQTLGDIRAMAFLGKYYGHKILGSTEVALYRRTKGKSHQDKAITELTAAAKSWERYTATAKAQYINPVRLNRTGVCDWKALTAEVAKDVEIARTTVP